MAFLAASVAVDPPAPMATEVLAIAVTDKPVAKAQSPVAVTERYLHLRLLLDRSQSDG